MSDADSVEERRLGQSEEGGEWSEERERALLL